MIFLEGERDLIAYDDDWQSVSEPEYPRVTVRGEDEGEAPEPAAPRARSFPKHIVLSVQLALCVLLGLAAFGLKSVGGEAYETAKAWYESELNDTAVFDRVRGFDAEKLTATADEL